MLTIHGEKELDKILNCKVQVVDIQTNKQVEVEIGAKQLEVLVFHDYLNVYRIPLDYYLRLEDDKIIKVKTIWEEQINRIFTKYKALRDVKLLRVERIWFGEPSCNIWYEKDYIVSKMS